MLIVFQRLKVGKIMQAISISHAQWFQIWMINWLRESDPWGEYCEAIWKKCLALFDRNPNELFVTVNGIWIHYNTPETQQETKQWVTPGELALKKPKVFSNTCGVIHIDYLQRTINGEYFTNLLDQLNDDLKKNSRIWPRRKSYPTKTMERYTQAL